MIFEDIIQEKRGQWDNWLLFFLKGVSSQSLDAITRIERLGQLRTAYRERLYTERTAARLLQTLDVLCARPILNIRPPPEPLVLTDAQDRYLLGLHLEILGDPGGELLTKAQIRAPIPGPPEG